MDSILDRLDFYENPKCVIWHANVTQVVSFLHILARLPQKVEIASHASCSHSTAVPRYCMMQTKWQVGGIVRDFIEIEIQLIHAVQFQF